MVVAAENILSKILKNAAELIVLGRIKIRVRSGSVDPTAVPILMLEVRCYEGFQEGTIGFSTK